MCMYVLCTFVCRSSSSSGRSSYSSGGSSYSSRYASMAAPRMWAEECEKTVLDSASSNLSSDSRQSPAKGLRETDTNKTCIICS